MSRFKKRLDEVMERQKLSSLLHPFVAAEYEVAEGTLIEFACAALGHVDLRNVRDLEFARQLEQLGYLKKKV